MSTIPPTQNPPDGDSRPNFEGNQLQDDELQRIHTQLMREKEEPTENFSPTPLFLVGVFMIFAFWAGVYFVRYSGDMGPYHYDETLRPGAMEAAGPRVVDMLALGKRIYSQNCVACHQTNGRGLPGVYPTLVNADWVQDNPERLVKVILAGLAGPVVVNGNPYNNAMTAFGRLSDQQVAAVLTFIRTDPDFENNSHAVSEELVAEVRAAYGARTEPWSQVELEAIHGPVTGEWAPPAAEEASSSPTGEGDEAAPEEAAPAPQSDI